MALVSNRCEHSVLTTHNSKLYPAPVFRLGPNRVDSSKSGTGPIPFPAECDLVFKEILKSKRKYKVEELYAVGLQKISKDTCLKCHNEESPTINPGDTFDYEKRKDQGTHEHKPLKQREG